MLSLRHLGLNTLPYSEYQRLFRKSGLTIIDLRFNQGQNPWPRVFRALARIPPLEDYVIHNLYCILEQLRSDTACPEHARPLPAPTP